LTNFTTNYLWNYCQTQWSKCLLCFDFKINYRSGKAHGNADPLTH
jgi:hypothetical protein